MVPGTLMAQSTIQPTPAVTFPPQITHVVVMVQENRTPDNLFHFLSPQCPIPRGASGLAACTPSPVTTSCYDISPCGLSSRSGIVLPVTLTPVPLEGSPDPNHQHSDFIAMCDADPTNGYVCRNDGAWHIRNANNNSYAYVANPPVTNWNQSAGSLLGPYLTFAEQYGWANFMYQTNQGPSYPAHQFIFSGTSARSAAEDAASTFVAEVFSPSASPAGCLAWPNATSALVSPSLGTPGPGCVPYAGDSVQECKLTNTIVDNVGSFCSMGQDKETMASLLDNIGVSWKYYAPDAGDIWTAPNAIQTICVPEPTSTGKLECTGKEWITNVDVKLKGANVLKDITNCQLAGVSWVIPDGSWSDHAGGTKNYGPSWVAAVINAIGQNPTCPPGTADANQNLWSNTAIIVTWDDWGGWSDNQIPPLLSPLPCTSQNCQGDYQYGFRVPLVVVSAYTPRGFISNETYDFGSILRTIEGIYGIREGALGVADARAGTDLRSFFTGSLRSYTPVPALEPASFFLGAQAQSGPPTPPDNDGDDD